MTLGEVGKILKAKRATGRPVDDHPWPVVGAAREGEAEVLALGQALGALAQQRRLPLAAVHPKSGSFGQMIFTAYSSLPSLISVSRTPARKSSTVSCSPPLPNSPATTSRVTFRSSASTRGQGKSSSWRNFSEPGWKRRSGWQLIFGKRVSRPFPCSSAHTLFLQQGRQQNTVPSASSTLLSLSWAWASHRMSQVTTMKHRWRV